MRLDPSQATITDAAVEQAFDAGAILRTHVLRPTWHFVAPADIRWLLALTAPRVHAINAPYYRRTGLDGDLYPRACRVLTAALQDNTWLTRDELRTRLAAVGIATKVDLRLAYLLMRAELDGLICSGRRRGKQFTYALLDERVPPSPAVPREQALAELARRYFTSHGPATVYDLARWASLTLEETRLGLAAAAPQLESAQVDDQTFWFAPSAEMPAFGPIAHLVSVYDEYVIGYKDWRPIADEADATYLGSLENDLTNVLLIDGRAAGTWKRTVAKRALHVTLRPLRPLTADQSAACSAAAHRLGTFLGLPVTPI